MQKEGNTGSVDLIQFDNDLHDMLQRQDQINGEGRKLECAFNKVESEVILALHMAKGTSAGEDRLLRILLYIRTSSAILPSWEHHETGRSSHSWEHGETDCETEESREHGETDGETGRSSQSWEQSESERLAPSWEEYEAEGPTPSWEHCESERSKQSWEHNETGRSSPPPTPAKQTLTSVWAREHTSHSKLKMNLSEDYESRQPRSWDNVDFDVLVDEQELYPEALVHTSKAAMRVATTGRNTGPHCTWCGSRTCSSRDGNQCPLVWINNRTGAVVLSTRKFGMLKHTSGTAYEAAFAEARQRGVLRDAAPQDLDEFRGLVEQSVEFYKDRDYQYQ
jgi:hypothetical protein